MSGNEPLGFWSYARFNDKHDNGRLTRFCERLAGEVEVQTGLPFPIFQDRKDIAWGEQWIQRIEETLDGAAFLIPVLTPNFFQSEYCKQELLQFLERERRLGCNDLIFPIYYVTCPMLNDGEDRSEVARAIAERQFFDVRELRFEPLDSPLIGKAFVRMAIGFRDAIKRHHGLGSLVKSPDTTPTPQVIESTPGHSDKPVVHSKNEPMERTVDSSGKADFTRVSDAVQTAQAGTRIVVRPGVYDEALVIDKPLEIVGDGERGDIVLQSSSNTVVVFKASMGRISNITIQRFGGGEEGAGVDITQGRLELDDCDISSRSLACVLIHGGADPRLRGSQIHGGKQAGVFVYDHGRGILEKNEISGHELNGVEIQSGGCPTLRNNAIHDCGHSGIYVYDSGQGIFEDNDIYLNKTNGCAIRSGGNPSMRRNRIHGCDKSGVYVFDDGLGVLEDNDIFGNSNGVVIERNSKPNLRNNRIYKNTRSGVHFFSQGSGRLEDNEIEHNAWNGVEVANGKEPVLLRNHIFMSGHAGVYVHAGGRVFLEQNVIENNQQSGVAVVDEARAELRFNTIGENGQHGVYIDRNGGGVFEDNELRSNLSGAWYISHDSQAAVRRSRNREAETASGPVDE